jgi:hypothetical protein
MKSIVHSFCFILLMLLANNIQAQDTTAYPKPKKQVILGLNITQTLTNFINGTSPNIVKDPYLITMRYGTNKQRFRAGANFKVNNINNFDLQGRKVKNTEVQLRLGYEWNHLITPHFSYYFGTDLITGYELEDITTQTGVIGGFATLKTRATSFGAGPVMGFIWQPHPRVFFSTEASLYLTRTIGNEKVNAPPDFSNSDFSSTNIYSVLPTALHLNIVF